MIADELAHRIRTGAAPLILDVRSRREFAAGHVPGARHLPFWQAWFRAPLVARDRRTPVVVYCGHGPRARLAGAALRLWGFRNIAYLAGHMSRWRGAGHPVEKATTHERR